MTAERSDLMTPKAHDLNRYALCAMRYAAINPQSPIRNLLSGRLFPPHLSWRLLLPLEL
jgi:hypothetical protein